MRMITEIKSLLMRLGSCIRMDRTNPQNLHVEIDSVVAYLAEYNLYVPNAGYTKLVQKMLDEQVLGKIPIDINEAYLKRQIADALLQLASNMIFKNEHEAEHAHQERIRIFGPEGTLINPSKGKTTM